MARTGQLARLVSRFAPPLALMALVFALSAQPDLGTGLGTADLIARKLVHMAEYGLLFLLWLRALVWRAPWAAALIAIAYAATDEYHQSFVEGRHGTPVDVLIDGVGIAIAMLVLRGRRFRDGSSFVRSHDRVARTGGTGKRSGGFTGDEAPGN